MTNDWLARNVLRNEVNLYTEVIDNYENFPSVVSDGIPDILHQTDLNKYIKKRQNKIV